MKKQIALASLLLTLTLVSGCTSDASPAASNVQAQLNPNLVGKWKTDCSLSEDGTVETTSDQSEIVFNADGTASSIDTIFKGTACEGDVVQTSSETFRFAVKSSTAESMKIEMTDIVETPKSEGPVTVSVMMQITMPSPKQAEVKIIGGSYIDEAGELHTTAEEDFRNYATLSMTKE